MADFFPILRESKNMRFMPTPPHQTAAETKAWMDAEMSREGAHLWSIGLRDGTRVIGYVNFLGETRIPGMGYLVDSSYWGNGFAPEACRAVLGYGFEQLEYDRVELWINEHNAASLRVAQKVGFNLKGRIPAKYRYETTHHFMLVYGLLAREWQGGTALEQAASTSFFGIEPVLMVHDVLKSARYYRDVLDFAVDFVYGDPPDHAAVSRGDWTGSMATIQLTRVSADRTLTPSGYLYIITDTSLDELSDVYRNRGVEIVTEPEDRPWGMREFSIRDLNGHVLVFGAQQ